MITQKQNTIALANVIKALGYDAMANDMQSMDYTKAVVLTKNIINSEVKAKKWLTNPVTRVEVINPNYDKLVKMQNLVNSL
jgi:hypothetical protein